MLFGIIMCVLHVIKCRKDIIRKVLLILLGNLDDGTWCTIRSLEYPDGAEPLLVSGLNDPDDVLMIPVVRHMVTIMNPYIIAFSCRFAAFSAISCAKYDCSEVLWTGLVGFLVLLVVEFYILMGIIAKWLVL